MTATTGHFLLRLLGAITFGLMLTACSPAPNPSASEQNQSVAVATATSESSPMQPTAVPRGTPVVAASKPAAPLLVIEKQHLVAGDALQRFQQGDQVRLNFRSDQDAELHLHGYDLTLKLKAGQPALLSFNAEHAGRFEIELHGHHKGGHAALGVVEIYP